MPYKRIEFFEKKEFGSQPLNVDVYYIFYGNDLNTNGYTASLAYKSLGSKELGRNRILSNTGAEDALNEFLNLIRSFYGTEKFAENLSDWTEI